MLTILVLALIGCTHGALPIVAVRSSAKAPAFLSAQQQELGGAVSTGGLLGFCAGRAAKAAGDEASLLVGAAFIFLSALQKGRPRA